MGEPRAAASTHSPDVDFHPPRKPSAHSAGRPSLPPELARSHPVRVLFAEGQMADIEHIAKAWGVPKATALYGMVSQFLRLIRDKRGDTLPADLDVSQACRLFLASLPNENPAPKPCSCSLKK